MGVPLRPMTNPHLVSDFDFNRLKPTPLGGASSTVASRIPPNAFKSGGLAGNRTRVVRSTLNHAQLQEL